MAKDRFKVFILLFTFNLALLKREYCALVNLKNPVLNISGVVILLTKYSSHCTACLKFLSTWTTTYIKDKKYFIEEKGKDSN